MVKKKPYIKPGILRVKLDSSVSLMLLGPPMNPMPRGDASKGSDNPFASPFGDSPFK